MNPQRRLSQVIVTGIDTEKRKTASQSQLCGAYCSKCRYNRIDLTLDQHNIEHARGCTKILTLNNTY